MPVFIILCEQPQPLRAFRGVNPRAH